MYQCECGRTFESKQAYCGHCGHCKSHLDEERYLKNLKLGQEKQVVANKARTDKLKQQSESFMTQWISEQHTCEQCGKVMTEYYGSGRFCCRSCSNKYTALHQSSEAKAKKLKKLKKASGWLTRRNQESYAEAFWRKVLENNQIPFEQEYKVNKPGPGCYFLDFLLPGNVDLEIDGHQHYEQSRKEHDKRRDEYLTSQGYIVYRIKYVNPKNSLRVKEDIDRFLEWYHSIV